MYSTTTSTAARSQSRQMIQEAAKALLEINSLAHAAPFRSPIRSILFQAKDQIINDLICEFGEGSDIDLSYQRCRGRHFVLVTLPTRPRMTLHMPIDKLSASAEATVIFQLGICHIN